MKEGGAPGTIGRLGVANDGLLVEYELLEGWVEFAGLGLGWVWCEEVGVVLAKVLLELSDEKGLSGVGWAYKEVANGRRHGQAAEGTGLFYSVGRYAGAGKCWVLADG